MQEKLMGGDDARPYRAQVFIPCIINQCPGPMQLIWSRKDGTLLQRPFNDGPFYRCQREGCYYHDHPRGLHEMNSEWLQDANRPKDRIETERDIERKKEVLV